MENREDTESEGEDEEAEDEGEEEGEDLSGFPTSGRGT